MNQRHYSPNGDYCICLNIILENQHKITTCHLKNLISGL